MNGALKLFAWAIALALVALPIVGVLNGWFAADRWPVTRLSVQAEFDHVSAEQIRAAAQPHLGQGFFAIHLGPLRDAIAKLPWVERVEARKRWPDTVDLVVYEQQPYARWGADRLVNRHGQLFAVADAAGLQGLPRLSGPDDRIGVVVGLGLNTDWPAPLPDGLADLAVACNHITGSAPDREDLLVALLARLDAWYGPLVATRDRRPLLDAWRSR